MMKASMPFYSFHGPNFDGHKGFDRGELGAQVEKKMVYVRHNQRPAVTVDTIAEAWGLGKAVRKHR